jgi:hypothetical protein
VTVNSKVLNGAYHPWWNSAEVTIYGAAAAPREARVGDQVIQDVRYDSATHAVTLTVPEAAKDWSLQVNY